MVGAREGGVGRGLVAVGMDEADVVLAIVIDERRARRGSLAGGHDGGQRLVVDLDQFGGVRRLVPGLGHHEGDVIADPAHAVLDQRRILRPVHRRAVAPLEPAWHRQVAEARRRPVRAGEHREHAGRRFRFRGVDRPDARMGVGRAQHVAEGHAGQRHVVDIAAAAAHEPHVLEPRHGLADGVVTHSCSLRMFGEAR